MSKAKEISALYKDIKQQMGRLVGLCHEIESNAEVTADAYQRGYKEAYDTAYADAEEIYESGKRVMYQKGLKDAWEAARKISSMDSNTRDEVFGLVITSNIIDENSASEAIEKIRQYEQEKDRQARIEYNFDEIEDIINTTMKECNVSLDEIAEVLAKMKENNDNK